LPRFTFLKFVLEFASFRKEENNAKNRYSVKEVFINKGLVFI